MSQWTFRTLCISSILALCQLCAQAYLINTWAAREWASGFFSNKCHLIPKNMTLCYGIGYDQMRLPNLLNHESVDEAIQQSNIWNLLDKTKCHDDLRIFLCSLYAPVCLKEGRERQIIKPCRSLCHLVRDNCVPRMRMFGYEWPAMARCDQFPEDSEKHVCIPPRAAHKKKSQICKACNQALTFENIISNYCMAKVVMKGKMKSHKKEKSIYFLNIHKKRRYFRSNGLTSKQKKSIVGELKRQGSCTCPKLSKASRHDKFLIMGDRNPRTGRLDVMFLVPWQRKNRHFKRATRAIRKRREVCRREGLIQRHYNLNLPRTRLSHRKIQRPSIHDPMGLGRGDSSLPLSGTFAKEVPRPINKPQFPNRNRMDTSKMISPGIGNTPWFRQPSETTKPLRGFSTRKGQRENRRGNQRNGRKKNGRRRKGQRKGRGRGRGNKSNRNREKGTGKKKRKQKQKQKRKRKRKLKMRRSFVNRYYSMSS